MKQVIVVNESLDLPRGKLAAQVAHASVAACLSASESTRAGWVASGMTKIVLSVAGSEDLKLLHQAAAGKKIPSELVHDAGRTVVPAGTITCLGIGPAESAAIDELTGHLDLVD